MSFDIVTMYNASDKNVLSKRLNTISTISGTLREECSILRPKIRIEGQFPTNCNYMYIQSFGRYYFVDDVVSLRSNLYEISAHVDVLKTYESQIRGCTGIIARQQSQWNMYIDDGVFTLYQNSQFKIEKFSGSGFTTEEFLLAVAGR